MTVAGNKRILGWAVASVLVLMTGAMGTAYGLYAKLESSLQRLQVAYTGEQSKNQDLSRRLEEITRAMEQNQARAKDLVKNTQAADEEKQKLLVKVANQETEIKRWQIAFTAEQEKTKKLSATAKELLQVMEQAQVQLKTLNESYRSSLEDKRKLTGENQHLKAAVKQLQTTYATSQAENTDLTKQVEGLTESANQAKDRVQTLEEAERGRAMMEDKERDWKERSENWGHDVRKELKLIFF